MVAHILLYSIFILLLSHSSTSAIVIQNESQNLTTTYKILIVLPKNESRLDTCGLTIAKVKPVVDIALADVVDAKLLPPNFLKIDYFDSRYYVNSHTAEKLTTVKVFREYFSKNLDGLLGFADSYTLATVAKVTAGLPDGLPIITTAGRVSALGAKTEYPYLTRMQGSWDQLAAGVYNFLQIKTLSADALYNIGFFFDDKKRSPEARKSNSENEVSSNCYFAMHAIKQYFVDHNKGYKEKWRRYVPTSIFDQELLNPQKIQKWLKELSMSANKIILCASTSTVRKIMIEAQKFGLTSSKGYTFINVDVSAAAASEEDVKGDDTNSYDAESLKKVVFKRVYNEKFFQLEKRISERAEVVYNYGLTEGKPYSANDFVTSFYDSIMLYAYSLNKSLAAGENIKNAAKLTYNMWHMDVDGITGKVSFNKNGDRILNVSFYAFDRSAQKYIEAAVYSYSNDQVDVFNEDIYRKNMLETTKLCGWDKSKCAVTKPNVVAILEIIGLVCLSLALLGGLYYLCKRDRALRMELANLKIYRLESAQHQNLIAEENALKVWKKTSLVTSPLVKVHVANEQN